MSNLLTTGDVFFMTGILDSHWSQFSSYNTITIHKEPQKTYSNINATIYNGYEETSNESNYTFTPRSANYPAIVIYNDFQKRTPLEDVGTTVNDGEVRIKIKEDAKNYLEYGKTECIELNGTRFNQITSERVQNYLGLKFYIYKLVRTL